MDQAASDPLDFGSWAVRRGSSSSGFGVCRQAKGPLSRVKVEPGDTVHPLYSLRM